MTNEKKDQPKPKVDNMSFGMLDLGGGEESPPLSIDTTEPPPAQETKPEKPPPIQQTPVPTPTATKPEEEEEEEPEHIERREEESRYQPIMPQRRYSFRWLKILAIILVIGSLIAGGVWGYLKWRENVEAEKQEELDQLNLRSRDSMMNEAVKDQNP